VTSVSCSNSAWVSLDTVSSLAGEAVSSLSSGSESSLEAVSGSSDASDSLRLVEAAEEGREEAEEEGRKPGEEGRKEAEKERRKDTSVSCASCGTLDVDGDSPDPWEPFDTEVEFCERV
jgi:hypothetical protein